MSVKRLIVGLGNPGAKYVGSRHNIGWQAVDAYVSAQELSGWSTKPKLSAEVLVAGDVVLAKPQTFMNNSGSSVAATASYYDVEPSHVLVVSDDFNLPFGTLRLRTSGSSGGQKGLEDIIQKIGTTEIPRLRIGIGEPLGDPSAYVLQRFTTDQSAALPEIFERTNRAITEWVGE